MEKHINILVDLFLPMLFLCALPPHQTIRAVKSLISGLCCFHIYALPIDSCHLSESSILPQGWLLLVQ